MLKRFITIFIVAIITSACNSSKTSGITGTWNFHQITNTSGQMVKPCSPSDQMTLSNGAFNYAIDTLRLKASGSYSIAGDTLHYHYILPKDTTRSYFIKELNDSSLTIQEAQVLFQFKRP